MYIIIASTYRKTIIWSTRETPILIHRYIHTNTGLENINQTINLPLWPYKVWAWIDAWRTFPSCLWISALMDLYTEQLIAATPTSLHPSLHPQPLHHPESLPSGRDCKRIEVARGRWCQLYTLLMLKKGIMWCLLKLHRNSYIKMSTGKMPFCSLSGLWFGWAVSHIL